MATGKFIINVRKWIFLSQPGDVIEYIPDGEK